MNTIVFHVLGASKYDFDGLSGTKVFTQQPSHPDDKNKVGIEVVEYSGDVTLFDCFRSQSFPQDFECDIEFVRAAKGKAGVRLISARPKSVKKAA